MRWFTVILLITTIFVGLARAEESARSPEINSVAIIRVPEPREIVTMNKGSFALALGGIGGALVSLDAYYNQKGLLGAIARTKFSFSDQLTQDLTAALTARGIKIQVVNAERNGRPDKLLDDYSVITVEGAEAILDVSMVSLGYATEHFLFSPHWRPEVSVRASLVLRASSQRLYEERIMYGLHNPLMSAAKLDAPKQFQFSDQEAMDAADDATLIGGLKDASIAIATHIAKNMRPGGAKIETP